MLRCRENGNEWRVGKFENPTLGKLKEDALMQLTLKRSEDRDFMRGRPRVRFEVGDVANLLKDTDFRHATFQVASQFNCLEFINPTKTPEDGIRIYEQDKTQGPACSIACGPATVVRNYFLYDGQCHINNIDETLQMFPHEYVRVKGGYTLPVDPTALRDMREYLEKKGIFRDASSSNNCNKADMSVLLTSTDDSNGAKYLRSLMDSVRVGVHSDIEVTSSRWGTELCTDPHHLVTQVFCTFTLYLFYFIFYLITHHIVDQVFCSACSLAYAGTDGGTDHEWEPFARLALDSSYEACLWVTLLNACRYGGKHASKTVVLTILGGGAFGNPIHWIADAIGRALYQLQLIEVELDVVINSYSSQVDRRIVQVSKVFPPPQRDRDEASMRQGGGGGGIFIQSANATHSTAADTGNVPSEPAVGEANVCVVCLDARRTYTFVPCGHVVVCQACADAFMAEKGSMECPMCRRFGE